MSFNHYYQSELTALCQLGRRSAKRSLALAPFLGQAGRDPDMERLLEGFAMKHRVVALFFLTLLLIGISVATHFFSNSLMLVMERVNFIPEQSSIFSFEPYEINQGSSSYWIYGEDGENYYYFSYEPALPYIFIAKNNSCKGFDSKDFKTWCSAKKGAKVDLELWQGSLVDSS